LLLLEDLGSAAENVHEMVATVAIDSKVVRDDPIPAFIVEGHGCARARSLADLPVGEMISVMMESTAPTQLPESMSCT
jgi:hypothetical protein